MYWLSLVLDLTGVFGGMNTLSWLALDVIVALAALELCEIGFGKISCLCVGTCSWVNLNWIKIH